jgi:hypothetical protein
MDKTELESAELKQSEPSVADETESDLKHQKQHMDSSDKDAAKYNSDDLDAEQDSDNDDSEKHSLNELHNELVGDEKEPAAETTDSVDDEADATNTHKDIAVEFASVDANADEARQSQDIPEEGSAPNADDEAPSSTVADAENDDAVELTHNGQEKDDQEEPANIAAEEVALETSAPSTPFVKIVVSAILIVAVFSGFFIFENKTKKAVSKSKDRQASEEAVQTSKVTRKEILDIPIVASPSIYDTQIHKISELRDILLKKQAEIRALKQRYQQSIEELEKEILDEQRNADIQTFLQASGNQRIIFSLKTIQRRQAYIGQLERPFEWVSAACEELLYLKRRVMTDLQVSAVASGIDMDKHVQQIQVALQKYQPTADKLAIDLTAAQSKSLETIWQRVQKKEDQISPEPAYSKNQIISEQICAGDFNRLGELSEISVSTAKCISQMQGSDLFLNRIRELSPGAARQLCQWRGRWICMNGIRALSPRVAHYLFQWDGKLISLNGLTEFPPEIGETLLNWGGGQLELMGLQDSADSHARISIEHLAQWERSGGKLYVPTNLREKINALHGKRG